MQKFWTNIWYDLTHITFKGRASKKEYLYWFLFHILFSLVFFLFVSLPANILKPQIQNLSTTAQLMLIIYFFASIIIAFVLGIWKFLADITISVRRFHDFGKSAWVPLFWFWVIAIAVVVIVSVAVTIISAGIGLDKASVIKMSAISGQVTTLIFSLCYLYLCIFKKGDDGENKYGLPSERQ